MKDLIQTQTFLFLFHMCMYIHGSSVTEVSLLG